METEDKTGNLTTDERSQYTWNAKGLLEQVEFPDGFGQKYEYDARGRRTKTVQFNHQDNTQWEINYYYKGDSWNIDRETDEKGNIIMEYTYDDRNQPLSVTYQGETFWYIYNGHGDVVALTDINGEIAVRYEYDDWGLPTKMYNRFGEVVREGIGWIGDLNTGNGTPGSRNEKTDTDEIDQKPGNGNTKDKEKVNIPDNNAGLEKTNVEISVDKETTNEETTEETITDELVIDDEPTPDITTDLAKENPYRYAGYYFDRKTQFYYLQARYYDGRSGRFISQDPLRGDLSNPLSLNRYLYTNNNPVNYVDPSGEEPWDLIYSMAVIDDIEKKYSDNPTKLAQAYLEHMGFDTGLPKYDGKSVEFFETWYSIGAFQSMVGLASTGYITGSEDKTLEKMRSAIIKGWTVEKNIFELNPTLVSTVLKPEYGFISPIYGGVPSSSWGKRTYKVNGVYTTDFHAAIDIASSSGTPVYAIADGKVVYIPNNGSAGNTIVLYFDDTGDNYARYLHLSRASNKLIPEQEIKVFKGDFLGYVGNTGVGTGPHLHFDLHLVGKGGRKKGDDNLYTLSQVNAVKPLEYINFMFTQY